MQGTVPGATIQRPDGGPTDYPHHVIAIHQHKVKERKILHGCLRQALPLAMAATIGDWFRQLHNSMVKVALETEGTPEMYCVIMAVQSW